MKINDNILDEIASSRDKAASKAIAEKGAAAYDDKLQHNSDEIELKKKLIGAYTDLGELLKEKKRAEIAFRKADENLTVATSSENKETLKSYKLEYLKEFFKEAKEDLNEAEKELENFKEENKKLVDGFFAIADIKSGKANPIRDDTNHSF